MKRVLEKHLHQHSGQLLGNFLILFLNAEKLCQKLSTCQVSSQLDHPNTNYMGESPSIPICKKPSLFRVKRESEEGQKLFMGGGSLEGITTPAPS